MPDSQKPHPIEGSSLPWRATRIDRRLGRLSPPGWSVAVAGIVVLSVVFIVALVNERTEGRRSAVAEPARSAAPGASAFGAPGNGAAGVPGPAANASTAPVPDASKSEG